MLAEASRLLARLRRKTAAGAAQASALDPFFDANPVPLWVFNRESLQFLAVNEAMVLKYGFTREQFARMSLLDIRPQEECAPFLSDLRSTPLYMHGRIRRHRRADGTILQMAIYPRAMVYEGQPAVLVAAIDVSAQVAAEADLRKARAFLDTVFDHVPVSIFVKELRSDRYIFVNQAAVDLTGVPRDDIIGRTPADLEPGAEALAARQKDLQDLRAGAPVTVSEYDMRTMKGGLRRVAVKRVVVSEGEGEPNYMVAVVDDKTDLVAARHRIAYLDRHDPLTGLRNRATFLADFDALLRETAVQGTAVMLVSFDISNFTEVNDFGGPVAGDQILRAVAAYLNDDPDIALVGRVGGDEFMAALVTEARAASAFAHRLNDVIRRFGAAFQEGISLGIDAGISMFPDDGIDAVTLMANAEAAQHRAREQGQQHVCFFEASENQRLRDQRRLHRDLDQAIRRGEFVPHYQPQARIDGTIYGVEALLRWQHPERGLIPPGDFIPLAEDSGHIIEIGEIMLRQVCREAMQWDQPLDVAINLSPVQFEQANLAGMFAEVLAETGLPPERLEVEITERTLIGDNRRALRILRELKALGLRIAMDDFGTGYSSLAYLQAFPFDRLKIDRQFVADLETSSASAAIVKGVIGLGHGLGLPVLAEGVERAEQLERLRAMGCDEVQGYFIGRPQRRLPDLSQDVAATRCLQPAG